MKVYLTYFKTSGKFYSQGTYETGDKPLYKIWEEVRGFQEQGKLPGLIDGSVEFIISVEVPEHPHAHPHLII